MFGKLKSDILQFLSAEEPETESLLPPLNVNAMARMREFIKYSEIRHILDEIIIAQRTNKLSSIAVISEFPGEGKTFVSSAIAMAYAEMARKQILLVDTTTHNNSNSLEIERILEPDDIPSPDKTPIRHTLVVKVDTVKLRDWSSAEDGSEEYQVDRLIDIYRNTFGLILFDTCALNARNRNNINPLSVARRCDASILVISRRSANRGGMVKIRERMQKEKIPLAGIIYNEGVRS